MDVSMTPVRRRGRPPKNAQTLLSLAMALPPSARGLRPWWLDVAEQNPGLYQELEDMRTAYQDGKIRASFNDITRLINRLHGLELKMSAVKRYLQQ